VNPNPLSLDNSPNDKHIDIIRMINRIGYLYGLFSGYPLVGPLAK